MLKVVKFILVSVAVVAVLLVALGLYVYGMDQYEKLEANSGLMKRIHTLEEQNQLQAVDAPAS